MWLHSQERTSGPPEDGDNDDLLEESLWVARGRLRASSGGAEPVPWGVACAFEDDKLAAGRLRVRLTVAPTAEGADSSFLWLPSAPGAATTARPSRPSSALPWSDAHK